LHTGRGLEILPKERFIPQTSVPLLAINIFKQLIVVNNPFIWWKQLRKLFYRLYMKTVEHTSSDYTSFWETVGSVAAVTAAIAFGVLHIVTAKEKQSRGEMDTTDYLLRNQANRNRLLAAVERDKNRQFISRDLIEV
jgi:hypothetical protein